MISIDTLRKLGAILDFSEDLIVLRAIDATKVIPLQRSATGHQLIDLTEDWFRGALPAQREVPSLRAYVQPAAE